jgi:regulator of RNase E activity RraA
VLVVDMSGDHLHAPVGAVTAAAAKAQGAAGAVVDGRATDVQELRETGLPVFARGTTCLTTKRVFGDANGVVILAPEAAADVLHSAFEACELGPTPSAMR